MKTRLIIYLRNLGFTVEFDPIVIRATNGNDLIIFGRGRGRMNESLIQSIKTQLTLQGYDTTDFDDIIIKHHKKLQENVKMFLFARWMAMCYADTHIDDKGLTESDIGFNPHNAMSVLNREKGEWYKHCLNHFNEVVYPSYLKNGSVKDTQKFLK